MFGLPHRSFWPFAFVACFAIAPAARADSPATASPRASVQQLVQQLGDDSYDRRERARQQLLTIGLQAGAALEGGMQHPDPEIALRCRRVWDEVRILAGWQQVRPMIGDSSEARALYHKMFLADPAFWYRLAENPRPFDDLYPERREQLQQTLKEGEAPTWIIEGALANVFFFGVQAKQAKPREVLASVDELLRTERCRRALRDDEPLRDLWDAWAKATESDGPVLDRLFVALRNQRPQARDIAREMLEDNRIPAIQRQYALLALAKVKNPEDDGLIQKAMDDSSPLDTLFSQGAMIKSQLRDVALAATIYRAGREPKEFGFIYLKPNALVLYSPSTLGFQNEEMRTRAVKNWAAYAAEPKGAMGR